MASRGARRGPFASCEHGSDSMVLIKGREYFDQLSYYHLLKKDSVSWGQWVSYCTRRRDEEDSKRLQNVGQFLPQ